MKILENGAEDKFQKEIHRVSDIYICKNCNCKFEVRRGDPEIQFDFKEGIMWIRCPWCKHVCDLI